MGLTKKVALEQRPKEGGSAQPCRSQWKGVLAEGTTNARVSQVEGCCGLAGGGVEGGERDQKQKRVRQILGACGATVGVLASTG